MNHCYSAKCKKCGGEEWLWGYELEDAGPSELEDTMTQYGCDCMCHCDPDYTTFWIKGEDNKRIPRKYVYCLHAVDARKDIEKDPYKITTYRGVQMRCILHPDLTVELTEMPKKRYQKHTKKGGPEWKDMARLMKGMKKGRASF